ncbi:alpha/beta hydrolase fold domain-containing protein [Streptomyces sp. RB6PN23]|uniref:Alpha/beta hydrolase fold domain-containing protein n=1 Tax=Streptomyces silvisoli TaxID=3034235 RepID=A0ABT5ZF49_9ACTN|nr:alpha/beta hydrolase fold domain-containing protein [Streptomyces silvisoli]MDF3288204.1 alpha/beta hydrolase fold domain-containing protein [Streptomyces silvisoli]
MLGSGSRPCAFRETTDPCWTSSCSAPPTPTVPARPCSGSTPAGRSSAPPTTTSNTTPPWRWRSTASSPSSTTASRRKPRLPAPPTTATWHTPNSAKDAGEHRIDPHRIGIAGASGGGAPAAATALMLRDRQDARPCFLSLSYPMLDDRNETPASFEVTDLGLWDRRENLLAWAVVLGDRVGDPALDPYSAPARATDLTGIPDTFIAAAQFDVFRDEDMDFARRLIAAGVPVELHLYARAFHAWDRFAPKSTLARTFGHTWHDFLRRHMHG